MAQKERLDCLVYKKGLAESREKAKAVIMAGQVYVDNQKHDKPGALVDIDKEIEVRGNALPYVSRGGLKLKKALDVFNISLEGLIAMDIGASTGGFTDCMLQSGASKAYAIDVGYGQLAWKLRTDSRVVNLERTNFRYITERDIAELIDFASVDVSFISLKLILPPLFPLLKNDALVVCLIKPQFEAGRDKVGKKGVVRSAEIHIDVVNDIIDYAAGLGFSVLGLDYSPIKGPEGNIEFLVLLKKSISKEACDIDVEAIVLSSHKILNGDG